MKMDDDDDEDIAAAVFAGKRATAADANNSDDDLKSGMYEELKRKYDAMLAENKEQDKTINF